MSLLSRLALIPFLLAELFRERIVKPLRRRIVRWRVLNAIPAGESYAAIRHKVQRLPMGVFSMTFEEKLIQEVKDFVKTLNDRDTALAAKVAAETALDNEVTANMAEADALAAQHAMDEAALAATVSTATDELNGAEVLVSEQKSYLLGLIDGNEGTDPTPNETPVVVS